MQQAQDRSADLHHDRRWLILVVIGICSAASALVFGGLLRSDVRPELAHVEPEPEPVAA